MKSTMSKSSESISVSENGALSGASSIESLASNASLPSCFNGMISGMTQTGREAFASGRIPNWAVSFDRLLEDDLGVKYFTEFLRKEFSQENILFWLECERLRRTAPADASTLKELSSSIYDRFLSSHATSPVNIDSKGQRLSEEARSKPPHPAMFEHQQTQIYKLMKLDSYSRFLKSPLFRRCIVCEMEGLPLPLEPEQVRDFPIETHVESRHSFSLKHRKFFQRTSSKSQKSHGSNDSIHRDSSDSESGFLEHGSNSTRAEDHSAVPHSGSDASKICRLSLWDGSSTVMYAASGQATIREALGALCERRGVPLSAVDVYYQNEDRALALDQDVSVLAGQEVRVERRTLFRLDMLPIGRSVGVKAKPTKPIMEVLKPVVAKYGLQLDDLQTRLSGEKSYLDLNQPVQVLDSLRVCVDKLANRKDSMNKDKISKKAKQKLDAKIKEIQKSTTPANSDTEDLISVMAAARSSKMHDQCGLLSEMNLELPEFLRTESTSPAKRIPVVAVNNSNSNNSIGSDHAPLPGVNGYGLEVPVSKGGRLSPNHAASGSARARIMKMRNMEDLRVSTPVLRPEGRRMKISSADTDGVPSEFGDTETDTLSAVDDDPFVINRWMQSVSCTPKYPYAPDLETTRNAMSPAASDDCDDQMFAPLDYVTSSTVTDLTSSESHSSVAHDHKYTKRKVKSILV